MIRIGDAVRLSAKDEEDLEILTGIVPEDIHSIRDLETYLQKGKARHRGTDPQSQAMRAVIDRVGRRLMAEHTATPLTYRRSRHLKLYFKIAKCADRALQRLFAVA